MSTSKPDIAANTIYPTLARATVFELLDLLGKGLSSRKAPLRVYLREPDNLSAATSDSSFVLYRILFKGCVTKIYWYNDQLLKLYRLQARSSVG